jgi:hypothetical protein
MQPWRCAPSVREGIDSRLGMASRRPWGRRRDARILPRLPDRFGIVDGLVSAVHSPFLRARLRSAAWLGLSVSLVLAGCAAPGPATPERGAAPLPRNAEPPPANVNLSGFPLPYRQGYADGCASAGGRERKDATRFSDDGNYRTGWLDGKSMCARK